MAEERRENSLLQQVYVSAIVLQQQRVRLLEYDYEYVKERGISMNEDYLQTVNHWIIISYSICIPVVRNQYYGRMMINVYQYTSDILNPVIIRNRDVPDM